MTPNCWLLIDYRSVILVWLSGGTIQRPRRTVQHDAVQWLTFHQRTGETLPLIEPSSLMSTALESCCGSLSPNNYHSMEVAFLF